MRRKQWALSTLLLLSAATSASDRIGAPPAALRVDPFYTRHVEARGIPILSSDKVPHAALAAARSIVLGMTAHRPELARNLAKRGFRVAIMGVDEATTDLPEQRHWTRPTRDDPRLTRCERKHYDTRIGAMTDRAYWNARARGMSGPLTSGATEDVLGLRSSRYWGETIFVHEFSHDILVALEQVDPALHAAVGRAYRSAMARGLWRGEYASTTVDEYWAEGSQFWFESNRLAVFDGRRILNADDLEAYDPTLHALLGRVYGARHRLAGDPSHRSAARVPPGPPPTNTAEVC
ncbi:glycoside hydrolase [Sphingomonas sp. RS2018]